MTSFVRVPGICYWSLTFISKHFCTPSEGKLGSLLLREIACARFGRVRFIL